MRALTDKQQARIINEKILAHRARERGGAKRAFSFSSLEKEYFFHKKCEELMELADKKIENLKAQDEVRAVLFLELCKMWGIPLRSSESEKVENLVSLIDSLISLKVQCFCNDFRENPLPKLFRKDDPATELLYADLKGEKPKHALCNVCGGEFIPIAFGNHTCGACLLRGGKPPRHSTTGGEQ